MKFFVGFDDCGHSFVIDVSTFEQLKNCLLHYAEDEDIKTLINKCQSYEELEEFTEDYIDQLNGLFDNVRDTFVELTLPPNYPILPFER